MGAASVVQSAPTMSAWDTLRAAIIKQLDAKDHGLAMLIPFVYTNYPPKDKRRYVARYRRWTNANGDG